ncbi:hypothetical protein [Paenibacillus sp. UNC496MF]|uniref:hypothetical protein n=1 Tax=Paenibacillus sp. UNC496MF TaxID=1502753 RepID=UPI000B829FD7|nr:hypothetical protein [Paenibacillus sp. UNC496MF]
MFRKLRPRFIRAKTVLFLWWTWFNGEQCFIAFECSPPIWWLPAYQKGSNMRRVGFLWFAIWFGKAPVAGLYKIKEVLDG